MKAAFIVPESLVVSSDKLNVYKWDSMQEYAARRRLWSVPSLSLLTVAGLMDEDFSIDYFDLSYDTVESFGEYDIVFLSPSTSQANRAYELSEMFRRQGARVVMGGVHVSMMADEALEHADAVFIGESEETFPVFLKDLKAGSLSRVYKAGTFPDMNASPVPRYDLAAKYPYKSVPVQTSRGCPHQCEFCVSSRIYGAKYRRKSFEQVRTELEYIKSIWSKPYIFFTDDNFFMDENYSSQLIDYLKEAGLRWYAFSDARIADRVSMLEKMAASGCAQLLIGFESLSDENLASINRSQWKRKRRVEYLNIVERIQSYGIGVVGSFVVGLDADTPEVFKELYEFVEKSRLYATNITIVTPFPGTALYEKLKREKRIIVDDWSRYNGFELTFQLKNMRPEEFEKGMCRLYEQLDSPQRINGVLNYFKSIINKRKPYIDSQKAKGAEGCDF